MERNQAYIDFIIKKSPELIKYLDMNKLLTCSSLLLIYNIIKNILISKGITIDILSEINLNELYMMSNLKK